MAYINENYLKLPERYLFADVTRKANEFAKNHPDVRVLRLGVGDVTLPLPRVAVDAMKKACEEMAHIETFRGYGPEQGYEFLKQAVADHYKGFSVTLDLHDVFISDGSKSDGGNIGDIFSDRNTVMIPDPVYPVYVDTNVMLDRKIIYIDGKEENGFLPMPGEEVADIIYLCSPNNPTGAVYSKQQLKVWVDFALKHHSVILFDAAYETFITDPELPRSIYEVEGAKQCAIEICSFSKTAGFTGTRCGYTVVPQELVLDGVSLNRLWLRRQTTKFNGVAYVVQRGAEAVLTEEGQKQAKELTDYYLGNAKIIRDALQEKGVKFMGGLNSPYIWMKCPGDMGSWEFFDYLLDKVGVVGTPGAGFGKNGDGWFRLTAFGRTENTREAMERMKTIL